MQTSVLQGHSTNMYKKMSTSTKNINNIRFMCTANPSMKVACIVPFLSIFFITVCLHWKNVALSNESHDTGFSRMR